TGVLGRTAYLDVSLSEIVVVKPSRIDGDQSVAQRGSDHADPLVVCRVRSMATGFKFQFSAGNGAATRLHRATAAVSRARPAAWGPRIRGVPFLAQAMPRRTCSALMSNWSANISAIARP